MKPSTSLELLENHIGQLMNLLFSASDQPALKLLAQVRELLHENLQLLVNFLFAGDFIDLI